MSYSRFDLEVFETPGAWSYFEILQTEDEIPFHVSFRQSEDVIVFNQKANGIWGKESRYHFAFPGDKPVHASVQIRDAYAELVVEGHALHKVDDLPATVRITSPRYASLAWRRETAEHPSTSSAPDDVRVVDVLDFQLQFPQPAEGYFEEDSVRRERALALRFTEFLGSRSLPTAIQAYEFCSRLHIPGLVLARLFQASRVILVCESLEELALAQRTIAANGLRNARAELSAGAMAAASDYDGSDVLLVGRELFTSHADAVDTLCRHAASVHFFASEARLPTACQVFRGRGDRVKNVHVSHIRSPEWRLDRYAAGTGARRPGVDVVVSMYNARAYIEECVDSLLCPNRPDVRVIVVDDGSTDGCGDVVRARFSGVPEVRVERKENGGCASARNYGRLVSDATHLAFVDADDFVDRQFFSKLFDLAMYSGMEVVQGGFDFYDSTKNEPYSESYEEEMFGADPRQMFNDERVIHLQAYRLIYGQPTIWRRVYRRDFLDTKAIYFPENIRAFDDYIFHLLTLKYARDMFMMPDVLYHYRQHPAQDIKQGDERHFYELYMFRQLLMRSVEEGWDDFAVYAKSIVNCINWSAEILRDDLVLRFLQSSAEVCALVWKVYGPGVMSDELVASVARSDFAHYFREAVKRLEPFANGYYWSYLEGPMLHPDTVRMRAKLSR